MKGSGEDGDRRVLIHMGLPDPSAHRAERQRDISDDYTTNFDCARANSLSNTQVSGKQQTWDRLKKQNSHREEWQSMQIGRSCGWPALAYASYFYQCCYVCLPLWFRKGFCSVFPEIADEERQWQWNTNYNGRGRKMAEWRRNEHSLGPAPQILQELTGSYRFNSASSAQRKGKYPVLKIIIIKMSLKIIQQLFKLISDLSFFPHRKESFQVNLKEYFDDI